MFFYFSRKTDVLWVVPFLENGGVTNLLSLALQVYKNSVSFSTNYLNVKRKC